MGLIIVSLQDSGRATGGLASSLSPLDDPNVAAMNGESAVVKNFFSSVFWFFRLWESGKIVWFSGILNDALPMYEFEIPNSLVGLVIGIKGKTIRVRITVDLCFGERVTVDR